jgi:hypothetical protein
MSTIPSDTKRRRHGAALAASLVIVPAAGTIVLVACGAMAGIPAAALSLFVTLAALGTGIASGRIPCDHG